MNTPTPQYDDPRDAVFDVTGMKTDLGQRTGRSAMTVIIFALIKLVFTLGTTAVLARYVDPAEQGLFALAIPAVLIASGLSEFGLSQAIVQRDIVTHRLVTTLFWVNVALGVALGSVVALLGGPAAAFYDKPAVALIFVGLAPYVLFLVLTTQYVSILRRQMRIKLIEQTNLAAMIISSALAIWAAMAGWGLWALAVQLVFNPLLTFIFLLIKVGWTPSLPRLSDLGHAKSALAFGGTLTVARILGEMARSVPVVVIGQYFTEVQAGLFYRSKTFADMPFRRIGTPLSGAFIPSLSRLNDDPDEFRAMYLRQLTRTNLILVPAALLLMLCADGAVRILLGPNWDAAGPVLQWLGVIPITATLYASMSWVLIACGRTGQLLRIEILNFIAMAVAVWSAANFGFLALVITFVLVTAVVVIPAMIVTVIRTTPLDGRTMFDALRGDAVFIAITLAAGLALRQWLDLPVLSECAVAAALVVVFVALRILANADMRGDVLKALGKRRKG